MEENRFSGLAFRQGMLKSGSKVSGGADPILSVNSTYNTFGLSEKALKLLGVGQGDYVVLYDMAGQEGVTDHANDRFYISAGFLWNKVQQGAKLGNGGNFSFNIAWGAMVTEDMEITQITGDQLVARNMAILREVTLKNGNTQKGYIALKKGAATLVPYNVVDGKHEPVEVVDGVEVLLFSVTDLKFVEHTPQIEGEETPVA